MIADKHMQTHTSAVIHALLKGLNQIAQAWAFILYSLNTRHRWQYKCKYTSILGSAIWPDI